ncbi:hypothetical protein M407DRAFT_229273 [Tulasnella calospora MUT 4182]|uniref:Uncharacterized protein n=1 Tax=Tulasnella calospora MUT 4182 TaxID=1051891 RepID=A0A0C3PR66_9AGAM|nr:hypothetical protein M407DRAFT_229273 [Tulasnella calospora MUT 4182]
MASSSGSRSRRSSRTSKGSVESAGSRHSSGSEPKPVSTHDAHAAAARDRLEERIRTYNTLHTIPASPAPIQEEEDELSLSGPDTITNPQITRPSIPTFQPRTLTRNVTVNYGGSISKANQQDATPQRRMRPKRRPASEHLPSSWEVVEKPQGIISDGEGDVPISMVSAATSELGDLINHLDLAGTPEPTPVKSTTPRRPRAFTTGDSPVSALQEGTGWSPLKGRNVSTAHLLQPLLMPIAPLSTGNSTFGRRIVRPELPMEQSPTEHITSSRRSSSTAGTMDGSESIFDSPLKNRGRKQSGGSLLTNLGKASTGTMLSFHDRSVGKGSTGTMLSAFGPSKGSTNVHNAAGDVSLTAFGPGRFDDSGVEEDQGEADDYDIPAELQEILSSNSEDHSGSTEANLFCDLSIPGSASALMSNAHIESLLRRPSQTGNKSSVASIPPTSVPAIPLPAQPLLAMSSSSSLDVAHHTDQATAGSAIPRSSASNPSSDNLHRLSTSALHDHSTSLDTLDEEDSLSASDEDITDHTGRSSFDFTKELNRLNEGGSRRSFVEQMANTWKAPSQSTGHRATQEMPPLPSLDFLRQITHEDKMDVNSQKQSSSDDLPLTSNPNSTMYAIANLDLSLVLPSDEPKKSRSPKKPVGRKVDHVRASSLSESLDASMAALTSLNLSVNQPGKPRPHSTTVESDVSKRHTRIAQARAFRRFQNMRERTLSGATATSFGSVVNPGAPDPFSYDRPTSYMSTSGDESSVESSERRQNQTAASIPSISSYGAVLNCGVKNPFGYDPTMDYESRSGFLSQSVEMARGCNPRYSMDSDRSSFYFDSSKLATRGQRGDDSIISSRSRSTRPLSFRQQARPDSIMSTSSFAWGHGSQGMQGGRTPWAKDRHDPARDSILSESSFRRLSRPGLGDKMFESGPLYSIAGSPAQSSPCMEFGHEEDCQNLRRSVDSSDSRSVRFSVDSIFDKTGSNTSSISSPSVFGYDESGVSASQSFFAAGVKPQFRPLSMFSMASECDSSRDDDTMISMLGGDHTKVPPIESDAKRNVLGRRVGKPVDKTNRKSVNEWSFGKKINEVLGNKSATKSQGIANSSATAKENREKEAQGTLTRNTSLRISRARPPRRPTAASVLAPNTLRV